MDEDGIGDGKEDGRWRRGGDTGDRGGEKEMKDGGEGRRLWERERLTLKNRLLMKRRREHGECETREGGRGCLVFETKVCEYRRQRMGRIEVFREWILNSKSAPGIEVFWWMMVAVVGVLVAGCVMVLRRLIGVVV